MFLRRESEIACLLNPFFSFLFLFLPFLFFLSNHLSSSFIKAYTFLKHIAEMMFYFYLILCLLFTIGHRPYTHAWSAPRPSVDQGREYLSLQPHFCERCTNEFDRSL